MTATASPPGPRGVVPSRARTLRWIALGAALVVAALAVVLALGVRDGPRDPNQASRLLGQDAPDFDLPLLIGEGNVSLDALAGKAVVVNFWNSWCLPCRQELPALRTFWERHRDDAGFAMVGIVREDTPEAARAYAEAEGVEWITALDPDGRAALDFATRGQPETFVISPDGVVVASQNGAVSVDDLETMLRAARGGV